MVTRLEMHNVSKRFGATQALQNISLTVRPGEILALIGENGAGKSTLMKILSGALNLDEGDIRIDGQIFQPSNPWHARKQGIAMIYQELNLTPHLSVEENITLGHEPHWGGWLNVNQRRTMAREALEFLNYGELNLNAPVQSCTIAEQQIVEIARALLMESKVLIMDEPTSSLTRTDTEKLFRVIRTLRDRGVSIIYISHFLEECQELCDRFLVLRDGLLVGEGEMGGYQPQEIIRMMVGRDVTDIYPRRKPSFGEEAFALHAFSGTVKPIGACLKVRAGEILGVAGLIGAGRTEMLRACFGLDPMKSGEIHVFEKPMKHPSPSTSWNLGLGFLSEDRKGEGLMQERSLADNLTLSRLSPFQCAGILSNKQQEGITRQWMDRLRVRAQDPCQPIGELSGGNQQKVALARLLHHNAQIFLLDEPTRGIDVASKSEIYALMNELAMQGKAVIFASSHLPELLGVCDSIAVMCRGRVVAHRQTRDWTEDSIIVHAIGQEESSQGT